MFTRDYNQVDLIPGVSIGALLGLLFGYLIYVYLVAVLPLSYPFWFFWWDWQRSATLGSEISYEKPRSVHKSGPKSIAMSDNCVSGKRYVVPTYFFCPENS